MKVGSLSRISLPPILKCDTNRWGEVTAQLSAEWQPHPTYYLKGAL